MNSPKLNQSPFGDAVLCPVCYCEYDGRIMQCQQGHAVCEKCYSKLKECPHCRSVYIGTRNFVLEELMAKIKCLTFNNKTEFSFSKKDDSDISSDNGIKTTQIGTKTTNEAPNEADRPEFLGTTTTTSSATAVTAVGEHEHSLQNSLFGLQELLESVIVFPAPVQGKGQFICRIIGCSLSLPICRLLNHLRCFHREYLLEIREDLRNRPFTNHLNIPAKSYSKAYHISSYGLFFLIINVTKSAGTTSIKGWIQCACPNNDARNFLFTLQITYENMHAVYRDLVYGSQSDIAYIQQKEQCLTCSSSSPSNSRNNMDVEVNIDRNVGPKNTQRHSSTAIRILQLHQTPHTTSSNNEAAAATATATVVNTPRLHSYRH